jgi:hypothetical protein
MRSRALPLSLALGLAVLVASAAAQEKDRGSKPVKPKTHNGVLVKVDADKGLLVVRDRRMLKHEHNVAPDADITCDGKKCKLADLKPGLRITVTLSSTEKNTVTKITATTRKGKPRTEKPSTTEALR